MNSKEVDIMKGRAVCNGAASIINGIVTGIGASFGIGTRTEASVELTDEPGIFSVSIESDPGENISMAIACVKRVLDHFDLSSTHGARVITSSDIPISRGLKSSSSSSNAIVLAALGALGRDMEDERLINTGIDACIDAEVTVTGAYDDACATYFGGLVVTDNRERRIIDRIDMDSDMEVLIHVPELKVEKKRLNIPAMKSIELDIRRAIDHTLRGDYLEGMRINGDRYGKAMGLDTSISEMAIQKGALSAGISGTGPATVILCRNDKVDQIIDGLQDETIIRTTLSSEKARIIG